MIHLYSLFVFVLIALGITTALDDSTERCFSDGAPCSGVLDLSDSCEDEKGKSNATCLCVAGYIPLEQGYVHREST